jgi:hypothetical protein
MKALRVIVTPFLCQPVLHPMNFLAAAGGEHRPTLLAQVRIAHGRQTQKPTYQRLAFLFPKLLDIPTMGSFKVRFHLSTSGADDAGTKGSISHRAPGFTST